MPTSSPLAVTGTEPIVCAMPKSVILTVPPGASSRLAGLMSRWIIPAPCAACKPAAAWATMFMVRLSSSGPPVSTVSSDGPSTSSITRYGGCPSAGST